MRAFLRRLQSQSEICVGLRQGRDRRRRALGGALRHQRGDVAARNRAHRRRGRAVDPRRASWHPRPQRHRQCGCQFARRHPRRGAAGAGDTERTRRALRQRQSRDADSDAQAQSRSRRALRDGGDRGRAAPTDPHLARLRRTAQPGPEPPRPLRRRLGFRHQGRHPRFGAGQGPAHLRACDAGQRRQPAGDSRFRSGGPIEFAVRAQANSASRRSRTIRA